jgi:hypothetical protein
MTFQERSKLGMEKLSKQSPITLEKAKKQAQLLKEQKSITKGTIYPPAKINFR